MGSQKKKKKKCRSKRSGTTTRTHHAHNCISKDNASCEFQAGRSRCSKRPWIDLDRWRAFQTTSTKKKKKKERLVHVRFSRFLLVGLDLRPSLILLLFLLNNIKTIFGETSRHDGEARVFLLYLPYFQLALHDAATTIHFPGDELDKYLVPLCFRLLFWSNLRCMKDKSEVTLSFEIRMLKGQSRVITVYIPLGSFPPGRRVSLWKQ